MLNRIIIMGRLTKDPELRSTQSGTAVASFSLAVDRDYKAKDAERETDFIDVVAWRNTAEFVSKYFSKGQMAVVEGRLEVRNYTDRNGNKRRAFSVVAENIYFGSSKKDNGGSGDYSGSDYGVSYGSDYGSDSFQDIEDDGELPF